MGINDLWKLVKSAEHAESLSQLALDATAVNKSDSGPVVEGLPVIGIDMGTYFDECIAATLASGMHVASSSGPFRPFFFRLSKLLKVPALFVFAFDGPERPSVKRGTEVQVQRPLWWVDAAKDLIKKFGFCIHQAPGEAEADLAMFNRWGVIDAVITRDNDALVFGAVCVLKSLQSKDRRNKDTILRYDSSEISEGLGLAPSRLFFYALAAGGDYSPGMKGCGHVYASALARSGVGDALYSRLKPAKTNAEIAYILDQWRLETAERLRRDPSFCPSGFRNAFEKNLPQFPAVDIVKNYLHPANSASFPDYQPNTQAWKSVERPDIRDILKFCHNRLAWSDATKLLKTLRANVWEGLVLRMIYSPQCTWDPDEKAFGTSAHQLPIHSCCMKQRKAEGGDYGQLQARLVVREVDLLETFLGECDIFPSAKADQRGVKIWVPAKMVPGWASNINASNRQQTTNAKRLQIATKARKGATSRPATSRIPPKKNVATGSTTSNIQTRPREIEWFEPTGDLLGDLKQLEVYAGEQGIHTLKQLGTIDLTGDSLQGTKRARDGDRGEGPSKRRVVREEVIDLTD